MKFLCDAMLAHLGRSLRMAGYDTEIASGAHSDFELVEKARSEGRLLLTCDRQMLERKAAEGVVFYRSSNDEESWARFLAKELGLSWLHAPFTRCLDCNRPLEAASPDELAKLPESIKGQPLKRCPGCKKIFWEGGHVERMRKQLSDLQALSA
jgi:uncharacterized protein